MFPTCKGFVKGLADLGLFLYLPRYDEETETAIFQNFTLNIYSRWYKSAFAVHLHIHPDFLNEVVEFFMKNTWKNLSYSKENWSVENNFSLSSIAL